MSQVDDKETILSEDIAGHSDGENLKLVPVTESIRYRKRAQGAEKRVESLAEQLAQAKSEVAEMAEQLNDLQMEQKLTRKLASAGAIDIEATVLIAKAKIEGNAEAYLDGVVEQLKRERQHLFTEPNIATARKTAGARDKAQGARTVLEKAAKKAATTGNRTDLQEYLRLRRNFI